MENSKKSIFEILNAVNVNEHTEKKNGLTYLSWAWAWQEVKKVYPRATYKVYENDQGWNYFTDGKTCWVKTGVTIDDLEHIEFLPVMDFRNKSIPAENVTSFDVNKAIQRSLTKACARHGLGLYIYAGEDLPEGSDGSGEKVQKEELICSRCGGVIGKYGKNSAEQIASASKKMFGKQMCFNCAHETKEEQRTYQEEKKDQDEVLSEMGNLPFPIQD